MAYLRKNSLKDRAGDRVSMLEYLKKPEIELKDVLKYGQDPVILSYEETRYIESETKYAGYIRKQEREIAKAVRTDSMRIPGDMDFRQVSGLTKEAVEKLEKKRPRTLGEARKIPGMTPAAVHNMGLHLEIRMKKHAQRSPFHVKQSLTMNKVFAVANQKGRRWKDDHRHQSLRLPGTQEQENAPYRSRSPRHVDAPDWPNGKRRAKGSTRP